LDRREPNDWTFSPRDAEKVPNDGRRATAGKDRKTKCYPSEQRRLAAQKQARRHTAFTRLRHAYDSTTYRRSVRYAIQKAKRQGTIIPAWFPYQLRHGIATEFAQAFGQTAAQTWLGHENLETTSIYVEKQVGELTQTARLLDRHWASSAAAKLPPVLKVHATPFAG